MDETTKTKKEMAEKMLGEQLYTSEELHQLMNEMRNNCQLEIERARLSEKIYREMLFKILKIDKEDDEKSIFNQFRGEEILGKVYSE